MIYRAGAGQIWRVGQSGVATAAAAGGGALLSAAAISALVSWWALDETSGTRVDSHGSNDLTDNNTVGYAAGIHGNAADFIPANSENLSIASNASLVTGDVDFCMCGWFRGDALSQYPFIGGKDQDETFREYGFYFTTAKLTVRVGVGEAKWGSACSTATWYWFFGYHDSVNNLLGISINNGTDVTTSYSHPGTTGTTVFRVGVNTAAGGGIALNRFDGLIDELAFFKGYVLSADDRAAIYNSGTGVTYAEAVGA